MIIICEPLCQSISHEKVNSGFLYGLSLAYPDEILRLYAHKTHINALKNILVHDNITISKLEYKSISFWEFNGFLETLNYCLLFLRLFLASKKLGIDKIFFLSFSPKTLFVIKKLKQKVVFSKLKFTLVLHGSFETVANDLPLKPAITLPHNQIPKLSQKTLIEKIRQTKLSDIPKKIRNKIHLTKNRSNLTVKNMMEWNHSNDFKYISLSPHATLNAEKFLDTKKFNIVTVVLPTVFVKPKLNRNNSYVKFAIFGYGDSLVLYNVANALSQINFKNNYEIRIIGMDNRGIESFPHVTCQSQGKRLTRVSMENSAEDIDFFLSLYDKTRYRLTCSGSILEAISMVKPIIHFDNDCINQFNKDERPIGFRCVSFTEYVNKIADIIENFDSYRPTLLNLEKNILQLRDIYSIEKSVPAIRESFTYG